ncbi:hypothetical protein [Ammoniphilus sp. YIM 78166]|uniref:hypothetical protein n=1 Tax=Ammoniphilus sp. YIM 78166 TaxID=1644106 RepID=UPI00106F3755|nr:hypothetical protein [Ammoniphilus sp. YIM 78166]
MQKKWMGTLASLCFASFLFTGCGFNQAGTNQNQNLNGMSTTMNQGGEFGSGSANFVERNRNEWTKTAGDRWNRAPYARPGSPSLFRGDRAPASPGGDVLWGNRTSYMSGNQAGVMRTTNNSNRDVTDEARGWGNPNYHRYSRVHEPNSNIWGPARGPAVPEWTPEGRVYRIKQAAPYLERDNGSTLRSR